MTTGQARLTVARGRVRRSGGYALIEVAMVIAICAFMMVGAMLMLAATSGTADVDWIILNEQRQLQAEEADLPTDLPDDQAPILAGCGSGALVISGESLVRVTTSGTRNMHHVIFQAHRLGCVATAAVSMDFVDFNPDDGASADSLTRTVKVNLRGTPGRP